MRDQNEVEEIQNPERADERAHGLRVARGGALVVDEDLDVGDAEEPRPMDENEAMSNIGRAR